MSAPETIGSVCTKEEVKETEYVCACSVCEKEKEITVDKSPTFSIISRSAEGWDQMPKGAVPVLKPLVRV